MKLLGTTTELTNEFKRLMLSYNQYLWTVAWADFNFELSNLLVSHKSRIEKLCIGLHFYGTSPEFLEKFYNHKGVRFVEQTKGTYHPKLYLFRNGPDDWELLIGSANYTSSAFLNNTEATILISSSDRTSNNFYESIIDFIEEQWDKGRVLTEEYIQDYKEIKSKIKTEIPRLPARVETKRPIFELTWNEYVKKLRNEDYMERIKFLNWVKNEFNNHNQFHEINLKTRKSIAGFGRGERDEHNIDIGYFGTTDPRGNFKNAVIKNPEIITNAFSKIPKSGEVTKADYQNFIKEFGKVSQDKELACATRMLCLWRPDYFINFNGKNKNGICKALDLKKSHVNLETYWDLVVQPFIISKWGTQNKSIQKSEVDIYNNRVALLDCIYYQWDN